MQQLRLLSLASLGLALATVVAPAAGAQGRNTRVVVCRDGTRFDSDNASVCNRHDGVDGRATEVARRTSNDQRDDRRGDARDARDDRRDRRDDRRDGRDDRQDGRDNGSYDPRYDNRGNGGVYGNNGGVYGNNGNGGVYGNNGTGRNGNGRNGNGRNAVYEFQGTVDKEIQIQLRGNRAYVQPIGDGDSRSGRGGRVMNGLPQQEGTLVIERLAGRGDVDVMQQPSARNNYTATIRVRDQKGGADNYRFAVYFQPSGNGRFGIGGFGRN